ncbi:MAG: undecaprenyl-diphosphatase UppP [Candidatus Komeilibacteria bacterium]
MHLLYIIISSIIQSLTEFIPVSSSGHLVIWHSVWSAPLNSLQLDIVLHLGSLLALIVYFRKDIIRLFIAWLYTWRKQWTATGKLAWWLILSTVPAAMVGVLAGQWVTDNLRSDSTVIAMLIIVALLFLLTEKIAQGKRDLQQLNWRDALLIGIAQCLAFVPGTSRSGITIVAAMLLKIKRAEAARYSFLLAIPTLLGASLSGVSMMVDQGIDRASMIMAGIGLVITFVLSWGVIRFFLRYLRQHSLVPFALYRIVLALVLWLILYY